MFAWLHNNNSLSLLNSADYRFGIFNNGIHNFIIRNKSLYFDSRLFLVLFSSLIF